MKVKKIWIFIISYLVISIPAIKSQNIQSLSDYKEYNSIGKTNNGIRIGEWVDISIDSIIYRKGSYDSTGKPTGIWYVNFPDGTVRKTTSYKNNKVVNWSCYNNEEVVISVENEESIDPETFTQILLVEKHSLENNDHPHEINSWETNDFGYAREKIYHLYYNYLNIMYHDLKSLFKAIQFSGCMKRWDQGQNLLNVHKFVNGNDFQEAYSYKKNILRYKTEFRNDTVVRVTQYKKDGSIRMVMDKE